jgi:RNA polymerase sigma factor (TIGR02999 family)
MSWAMDSVAETTRLLQAMSAHDAGAAARLFPVVYEELRKLAHGYFRRQNPQQTLQPTALVHEAFLRLADQTSVSWQGRAHFLAVAAQAMRQILIDHARARGRIKRGGQMCRVTTDPAVTPVTDAAPELLDLDEALRRLTTLDERQGKIVELRFFGGLTVEEVAHVLGWSKSTVESEWRMARAWLHRELAGRTAP